MTDYARVQCAVCKVDGILTRLHKGACWKHGTPYYVEEPAPVSDDRVQAIRERLLFLAETLQTRWDDSARPNLELDIPTREVDAVITVLRDAAGQLQAAEARAANNAKVANDYAARVASAEARAVAAEQMTDAAEMLWVVLANVSGGNWTQQSQEWQDAAAQWRDHYFAALWRSSVLAMTAAAEKKTP